jgi:RNA polymerase sigma-70 factor, ECF subfamily
MGKRMNQAQIEQFTMLQSALVGDVQRFVTRLIGYGHAAVDDIVQDTFIALFEAWERLPADVPLRPYVFGIARNLCYDELRRLQRFDPVAIADEWNEEQRDALIAVDEGLAPDEAAHWVLMYVEVQAAMQRLPEVQRQTLVLASEQNMSLPEIAIAMQTNVGTVKSRLHYARRTLRSLLRPATLQAISDPSALTPSPKVFDAPLADPSPTDLTP